MSPNSKFWCKWKVKVLVTQSCLTLSPMDYSHEAPLSKDFPGKNTRVGCHLLVQGIFPTRDRTWVSCIAGRFETSGKPKILVGIVKMSFKKVITIHTSTKRKSATWLTPLKILDSISLVNLWQMIGKMYCYHYFHLQFWIISKVQYLHIFIGHLYFSVNF